MSYQKLSKEQLPDFIKLFAVVNGFKSSVKNFVLLHLECDSSFSDLDNLLTSYMDMDQHESRACRDKPTSIGKGRDLESHLSLEQQLETGGPRQKGKGTDKSKPSSTGEAYHPQPPLALQPTKARGSMCSFQQVTTNGAAYVTKNGTRPKLAGGTPTSNKSSSTNSIKLGKDQACRGKT